MINKENYEEYLCSYVDGELNEAEVKALFQFLEAHPELKKELTAFEATKLQPDTSLVFENKNLLLQKEGGTIIPFLNWKTMSAAAAIALLLGMSWKFWNDDTNTHTPTPPIVAIKETPSTPTKDSTQPTTPPKERLVIKEQKTNQPFMTHHLSTQPPILAIPQETIALLPSKTVNDKTLLPVENSKQEMTSMVANIAVATDNIYVEADKKTLLDLLPNSEEKKAGLNDIAEALNNKLEQAKTFSQNLKETTFAFHLGGRDFILNY
jgi:hypothetical protein